jgi:hypothetical protein
MIQNTKDQKEKSNLDSNPETAPWEFLKAKKRKEKNNQESY